MCHSILSHWEWVVLVKVSKSQKHFSWNCIAQKTLVFWAMEFQEKLLLRFTDLKELFSSTSTFKFCFIQMLFCFEFELKLVRNFPHLEISTLFVLNQILGLFFYFMHNWIGENFNAVILARSSHLEISASDIRCRCCAWAAVTPLCKYGHM